MEERQNADTGNSGSSQQGNQPEKDAKAQNSQPEKPHRSSVPQYGRHNKRQYPHRGQTQNKGQAQNVEQGSEKEQRPEQQRSDKVQRSEQQQQPAIKEAAKEQQQQQQNAPKEQQQTTSAPRFQSRASQENKTQEGKTQEANKEQEPSQQTQDRHANAPAVKKMVPPKGPKKVPYNRYRKNYTNKDYHHTSSAETSQNTVVSSRRISFRKISIVVPLFNEEESLHPLANEIKKVMRGISADYEVILVDDGSTDKSLRVIKEISKADPKFRYISFRKNYGKSAALQMGFKQTTGDVIITMDADLQDDPNEILNLVHKLEEGYDLVSGWKKERFDPFIKRHSSKFFNYVTGVMSGIKIHDFNCGLKAYRKEVVQDIKVYGELHRYMPVLADWQGYRISEIPVKHHPRRYGKTKFGISRFFKGFIDLVTVIFTTRYIKRPMHLFGFLGAIAFFVGFLVNGYLSVEWMMGKSLSNRPLLFLGMLLIIVGIQFFSVGLLGEMMVHNFQTDKEYSIKEKS
ncbi:MAG: glycosyltransferase [Bacteroidota bacterium]|nr:glycosyltransferase [Bacteroidota bacterium]